MLTALYPDGVRASAFRIPAEVVEILGGSADLDPGHGDPVAGHRKYQPLADWLETVTDDSVSVTFTKVEDILGSPLAPSARKHVSYWYNDRNSLGGAITAAGFRASRANIVTETVTFVRRSGSARP